MKEVLIKVKDKSVVMRLKQIGNIETVSQIFNIYSMKLTEKQIIEVTNVHGVLNVEEDDCFEVQNEYII
ncbi:hypothetical protein [Proteiniborus sp.]|uniref:hypothetical protein n=1 Tax=Proteiniborus sp. TaxID=2079015 RepID=UPI00333243CB